MMSPPTPCTLAAPWSACFKENLTGYEPGNDSGFRPEIQAVESRVIPLVFHSPSPLGCGVPSRPSSPSLF